MADFGFVTDEVLRSMLARDAEEMGQCLTSGLCKATLVLAGSIIEAVLVDYLLAFPKDGMTAVDIQEAGLYRLTEWAVEAGVITARTRDLTSAVRQYRNLIHPGRERREQETVDIHAATVAAHLVEIIIHEVTGNYAKQRGYTTEEAIRKVMLDASSEAIFRHMIARMAAVEQTKLFRQIPELCYRRYLDVLSNDDALGEDDIVMRFVSLHQALKLHVGDDVVRSEVANVIHHVERSSQQEAMYRLRFYADQLDVLDADERQALIEYLLGSLKTCHSEDLTRLRDWRVFSHVGTYLDDENGVDRLLEVVCYRALQAPPLDADGKRVFFDIMGQVLMDVDYERCQALLDRTARSLPRTDRDVWRDGLAGEMIPF